MASTDISPTVIIRKMLIRHVKVTKPTATYSVDVTKSALFPYLSVSVKRLVISMRQAVLTQHHFCEQRKDSRPVKHFQFLKWVSSELPEKPQDLTDMIKDIKHSCGNKSQRNLPIVVHCK